jgi:enoyl-CoA hydratase/carnithine racemase
MLISFNRPERLNATNDRLHWELTQVWLTIAADPDTRVAVITGKGRAFSAGGDLEMVDANATDPTRLYNTLKEASDIVYNMINCDKPIISAINGVAVGAGLVVALLADISIMSESARITDGHTRLGVVAGDHAAILWPLLTSLAKAKYYLLTCDFHRRQGSRADRAREPLRARRAAHAEGLRGRGQARARRAERHPPHQAQPQQLASPGRPDLRQLDGARAAHVHGAGRAGGRARDPRETAAEVSVGAGDGMSAPAPFRIHVPDAVLADLRERLARVRWPDEVPGAGWRYGTDLATMKELVTYWRDGFDWRAQEAALNAWPQFTAPVGDIDVHFIHAPASDRRRCRSSSPTAGRDPSWSFSSCCRG